MITLTIWDSHAERTGFLGLRQDLIKLIDKHRGRASRSADVEYLIKLGLGHEKEKRRTRRKASYPRLKVLSRHRAEAKIPLFVENLSRDYRILKRTFKARVLHRYEKETLI